MPHERRTYRRRAAPEGLASFGVRIGETNLLIAADFGPEIKGTVPFTRGLAREARGELHAWRRRDPELWLEQLIQEMFLKWVDCELSTIIWDTLETKSKPRY